MPGIFFSIKREKVIILEYILLLSYYLIEADGGWVPGTNLSICACTLTGR